MRRSNYAIVDADCSVLSIEIVAFGRVVRMPAIFCLEADALHVASCAEGITGAVHAIIPVENKYTLGQDERMLGHRARL